MSWSVSSGFGETRRTQHAPERPCAQTVPDHGDNSPRGAFAAAGLHAGQLRAEPATAHLRQPLSWDPPAEANGGFVFSLRRVPRVTSASASRVLNLDLGTN